MSKELGEPSFEVLQERYDLAMGRIREIALDPALEGESGDYFSKMAQHLQMLGQTREWLLEGAADTADGETLRVRNQDLYRDLLEDHYARCWANPRRAAKAFGSNTGALMAMLAAELYELPGLVYESAAVRVPVPYWSLAALEELTASLELFIEIFSLFTSSAEEGKTPAPARIRETLYWFFSDYTDVFAAQRVLDAIDPGRDFAVRIVMDSDLTDLRYLYRYGEYVTDNELDTARFLNSRTSEEIEAMARTFTEGYRTGFVKAGKDLSRKKTVNIRYQLGFERMVREAVRQFEAMGLQPVIYRRALSRICKNQVARTGYSGALANPQFDYDHKEDQALFLDKAYVHRKLDVMRTAYEANRETAGEHAGPAVIEVFGEPPFTPKECPGALRLGRKGQALSASLLQQTAQLTNTYIIGEERSFTIIAFPSPRIGPAFEEIFRDTMAVNTMDSRKYEKIQQFLIDALDQAESVHVTGRCGNRTDLTIALAPLADPEKQTNFENCVADVNIPVGEVFTSPQLEGTNGVLHVSQVYLNGLDYHDLSLTFKDGMITDYGCGGFESEEAGREYVKNTVLFHHETLPMGEFAIGTNTAAYAMSVRYGIGAQLPILIAEKCGPHFAVGDTCYSWEEDVPVFNPDGKEVTARDNSVSLMRREDPGKAYFGCHTDITIPYSQLGSVELCCRDGSKVLLLSEGRFVLPGTLELNSPLEGLE